MPFTENPSDRLESKQWLKSPAAQWVPKNKTGYRFSELQRSP
jgi:hypothetical protein